MKIVIPFLGKTKEKFLHTGIEEYLKRLRHYTPVDVPVMRTGKDRQANEERLKQTEAGLLLEKAPAGGSTVIVALDPLGESIDSPALADFLQLSQNQGAGAMTFLIGGHLGLHSSVLQQSDKIFSLSAMTFTHEMTRLILLEQLYRAYTILAGQKYHK